MSARWLFRLALVVLCAALLLSVLPAAAPAAAQEPAAKPQTYVVQPGDTLSAIAQRFGTTVEALAAANDIADPALIVAGQKLVIPPPGPETGPAAAPLPPPNRRLHPVREGESLPFLAFYYRTTLWALRERNGLPPPGLVEPGQELLIPAPVWAAIGAVDAPGLPTLSASPAPVVQGQTLVVDVQTPEELLIEARLLDQSLAFAGGSGGYWALLGVGALTPPGPYTLVMTATATASGDRILMRETISITAGAFPTANIPIPESRQGLLDPELSRIEREKVSAAFAGFSERRLWGSPFQAPLQGELHPTSPFGQRRSYAGGPVSSYHSGQDYGADEGTPLYAPAMGTVVLAEPLAVRGNAIILDHGRGVFSGFWHLSRIDVAVGRLVVRGELIGLVGDTGLSTGPHLHWEMQVSSVPVDPRQWLAESLP